MPSSNEFQSVERKVQRGTRLGIDLGTTNSLAAFVDTNGCPKTIVNSAGDTLTPSAIFIDENDIVVGKEAIKASVTDPTSFAECFKRDIGFPAYRRKLRQKDVPPEVLSALILERLGSEATMRLGPVEGVVITVPAFFDETRRRDTEEAGRLAGLNVIDIINEPTAAAVAFGSQGGFLKSLTADQPFRVLVYDLGGGTFDVTILEIRDRQFRALATDGDVQLGGTDFDERLVESLASRFAQSHGVDPRSDPHDAMQLWLEAREAKHALTERQKTSLTVVHGGLRVRMEVTRSEFEDRTRDLVERTEVTTKLCLDEAKLTWQQIDRILLVGGATRMPMISEMLRRVTGKEPDRSASPDEVVAHGAAIYAESMRERSQQPQDAKWTLVNINSHSLGIVGLDPKTRRRRNVVLIPKNSALPCRATRTFRTARTGQSDVKISIVEGESHRPEECIPIGECIVRGLPSGLPQGTAVQVEYRYAANGRVSVTACIPEARQTASVTVDRSDRRDLGNLADWKQSLLHPEVSGASQPSTDRLESVTKRLDDLFERIGRSLVAVPKPAEFERATDAARDATSFLRSAEEELRRLADRQEASAGASFRIQDVSAKVQVATAVAHARTQEKFAFLVLGREISRSSWGNSLGIPEIVEIRTLQAQLTSVADTGPQR